MTTTALLFLLSCINLINKYHQLNYLFIIDVSKVRETSRKAKLNKEGVKKFNQRQMPLGMAQSNVINSKTLPFAVSNEFPAKQVVIVLENPLANINSN